MSRNDSIDISLSKSALLSLKRAFQNKPHKILSKQEFVQALTEFHDNNQVIRLYDKIDVSEMGFIDQESFMMFVLEYESILKRIIFDYQPKFIQSVTQKPTNSYGHNSIISCICYSNIPSPRIFTGGNDGLIYIWKAGDLSPISVIKSLNRNAAIQEELNLSLKSTLQRSHVKITESKNRVLHSVKATSITALHKLNQSSHLCVASADCSVIFYDLITNQVHGRVKELRDPVCALMSYNIIPPKASNQLNITTDSSTSSSSSSSSQTKNSFSTIAFLAAGDLQGRLHIYQTNSGFRNVTNFMSKSKNVPPVIINDNTVEYSSESISLSPRLTTIINSKKDIHIDDNGSEDVNMNHVEPQIQTLLFSSNIHSDKITSIVFIQKPSNLSLDNYFINKNDVYFQDLLLVSSMDGSVSVNNIETKKCLYKFKEHKQGVEFCKYSIVNKHAVSSAGRFLIVWNIKTLAVLMKLKPLPSVCIAIEIIENTETNSQDVKNNISTSDNHKNTHSGWGRIVAVTQERCIYVWDNLSYAFLYFLPPAHVIIPSGLSHNYMKDMYLFTTALYIPEIQKLYATHKQITSFDFVRDVLSPDDYSPSNSINDFDFQLDSFSSSSAQSSHTSVASSNSNQLNNSVTQNIPTQTLAYIQINPKPFDITKTGKQTIGSNTIENILSNSKSTIDEISVTEKSSISFESADNAKSTSDSLSFSSTYKSINKINNNISSYRMKTKRHLKPATATTNYINNMNDNASTNNKMNQEYDFDDSIHTVLYNNHFQLLIVVYSHGIIDVFEPQDGKRICHFSVVQNVKFYNKSNHSKLLKTTLIKLKSAILDKAEKKLLVLTSDYKISFWNFHTGIHLYTLSISPDLDNFTSISTAMSMTNHLYLVAYDECKIDKISTLFQHNELLTSLLIAKSKYTMNVLKYVIIGSTKSNIIKCYIDDIDDASNNTDDEPLNAFVTLDTTSHEDIFVTESSKHIYNIPISAVLPSPNIDTHNNSYHHSINQTSDKLHTNKRLVCSQSSKSQYSYLITSFSDGTLSSWKYFKTECNFSTHKINIKNETNCNDNHEINNIVNNKKMGVITDIDDMTVKYESYDEICNSREELNTDNIDHINLINNTDNQQIKITNEELTNHSIIYSIENMLATQFMKDSVQSALSICMTKLSTGIINEDSVETYSIKEQSPRLILSVSCDNISKYNALTEIILPNKNKVVVNDTLPEMSVSESLLDLLPKSSLQQEDLLLNSMLQQDKLLLNSSLQPEELLLNSMLQQDKLLLNSSSQPDELPLQEISVQIDHLLLSVEKVTPSPPQQSKPSTISYRLGRQHKLLHRIQNKMIELEKEFLGINTSKNNNSMNISNKSNYINNKSTTLSLHQLSQKNNDIASSSFSSASTSNSHISPLVTQFHESVIIFMHVFTAFNDILVAITSDNILYIWNLTELVTFYTHHLLNDINKNQSINDSNNNSNSNSNVIDSITSMSLSKNEEYMIVGHDSGRVSIWSIDHIALENNIQHLDKADKIVVLVCDWIAHKSTILAAYITREYRLEQGSNKKTHHANIHSSVNEDKHNTNTMSPCVITACADQSIRFWTLSGQHIGRFGKSPLWNLLDLRSWLHRQHRYQLPPNKVFSLFWDLEVDRDTLTSRDDDSSDGNDNYNNKTEQGDDAFAPSYEITMNEEQTQTNDKNHNNHDNNSFIQHKPLTPYTHNNSSRRPYNKQFKSLHESSTPSATRPQPVTLTGLDTIIDDDEDKSKEDIRMAQNIHYVSQVDKCNLKLLSTPKHMYKQPMMDPKTISMSLHSFKSNAETINTTTTTNNSSINADMSFDTNQSKTKEKFKSTPVHTITPIKLGETHIYQKFETKILNKPKEALGIYKDDESHSNHEKDNKKIETIRSSSPTSTSTTFSSSSNNSSSNAAATTTATYKKSRLNKLNDYINHLKDDIRLTHGYGDKLQKNDFYDTMKNHPVLSVDELKSVLPNNGQPQTRRSNTSTNKE